VDKVRAPDQEYPEPSYATVTNYETSPKNLHLRAQAATIPNKLYTV